MATVEVEEAAAAAIAAKAAAAEARKAAATVALAAKQAADAAIAQGIDPTTLPPIPPLEPPIQAEPPVPLKSVLLKEQIAVLKSEREEQRALVLELQGVVPQVVLEVGDVLPVLLRKKAVQMSGTEEVERYGRLLSVLCAARCGCLLGSMQHMLAQI